MVHYQQGGAPEFPAFLTAVESYATFHWSHMKTEENEVLPLAEKHLTASDWDAIDAAFLGHTDPLLGIDAGAKYDALFSSHRQFGTATHRCGTRVLSRMALTAPAPQSPLRSPFLQRAF